LVRQDRLIVVEKFSVEAPKTKLLAQKLKDMALEDVLIITGELGMTGQRQRQLLFFNAAAIVTNTNKLRAATLDVDINAGGACIQ
ncbi:hypothetical protein MJH54_29675, partial [Salmonella enterica subsp. enterica serovar Montevideo]|nr:hypothetical protein [Salmonella enterica subsp. enterica serovar Montevideo]